MPDTLINNLINGKYKNPQTGEEINIPMESILIGSGVIKQLNSSLKAANFPKKISIISDENTHFAAGAEIERVLCHEHYEVCSVVMPPDINPDERNIELLNAYTMGSDAFIAVGGGTISDLVKYTSFKRGIPYACVPTCPSVNGFTSSTASMMIDGQKKSLPAHLPKILIADTDILVQAPQRLIISGLGDSLGRTTAQADMLLSHYLLGTEYDQQLFDIQKDYEEKVFELAPELLKKNSESIEYLMRLLIVSGLTMYINGSSRPASGAEHLVAHYMEMMFDEEKYPHTYHGEQIAVTSIAMAKIQEQILAKDEISIEPLIYSEKPILGHFGKELGLKLLEELKGKEIDEGRAAEINKNLRDNWGNIRKEISDIHIKAEKLEEIIKTVRGPYTYKHLCWEHNDFDTAIQNAPFLRNRFTFLDLAICLNSS